jgi:TRIAD3 protein (E3 ubiquitin-protein ligase RNF216)
VSPEVTDPILLDEVEFTEQEMDEWKMQIQNRKQRRSARERATKEGTTLECMCCYADCAFEEMVSCRDEGHLFCVDCLRKHTEDRVFGFADLGGKDGIEITCIQIGTYVTKNLASQSSCSGINLFHCYKLSSIRRL